MLKIPHDVVQLLSLTVHGRWSMYTEKTRPPGGMRNCNETIIGDILNYTCVNSTDDRYRQYRNADAQDRVDHERITRVMRSSYTYWEGAYDSWATMQMKMCKACHDSTHRGGWVVFDLQYADVHNICNTNFVQGFGYVRRIKDYMLKPMTECVMNETVDIVERGIRQEWLLPPS
ncbi:uncharacterized protein LOC135390186 [Ornithodoros turicata]|uniref:uncharacterized protein LOC135390186 n=1 Tax=Ornithodoros turicata TaxID=34597 RepID=UPI0031392FB1